MDMFFNFVSTNLLHDYFREQACKSRFLIGLEIPRDNLGVKETLIWN